MRIRSGVSSPCAKSPRFWTTCGLFGESVFEIVSVLRLCRSLLQMLDAVLPDQPVAASLIDTSSTLYRVKIFFSDRGTFVVLTLRSGRPWMRSLRAEH